MKGIVLAGGTGSRLWPATTSISKQLLPVYDKPMVYYPIATLMSLGIRDLLILTTPRDTAAFEQLLGDGSRWGMSIEFAVQDEPRGIAQSLLIGAAFLGGDSCALILGDNIFHGAGFADAIRPHLGRRGATALAVRVATPEQYGIVELDAQGLALSIEEKPAFPKSQLAIPGLYLLDGKAPTLAASLVPSARGELEITELLTTYLTQNALTVVQLPLDTVWLDAGTVDDLFSATEYVRAIERRHDSKVGCLEEVAWQQGWIDSEQLAGIAEDLLPSNYGRYLQQLAAQQRGRR